MIRITLIFFLLINSGIMNAQPSQKIAGTYYLHGVMETASVIELSPDSSFRFFYSYGAVDRYGSGMWRISDNTIILNSRKRPPLDFKLLDSKSVPDSTITIQIVDKNKMLLHYVQCAINTKSGSHEISANNEGLAIFPKGSIESIELLSRLCPDRYSLFTISDHQKNFFQFGFEPWIAEIFFDNLKFRYDTAGLTGPHPLLNGDSFQYSKDE